MARVSGTMSILGAATKGAKNGNAVCVKTKQNKTKQTKIQTIPDNIGTRIELDGFGYLEFINL